LPESKLSGRRHFEAARQQERVALAPFLVKALAEQEPAAK